MVERTKGRIAVLAVAFFCIFALALAAGTLNTAVMVGDDGPPIGENGEDDDELDGFEPGGNQSGMPSFEDGGSGLPDLTMCIRPLDSGLGMLAYFGAAGLVLYAIYRRYTASVAMLSAYALTPFLLIGYFAATACADAGEFVDDDDAGTLPDGYERLGEEVIPALDVSPIVIAVIFGIALVGAIIMFVSASGDEEFDIDEDEAIEDADMSDIGRTAGAAADRLEERNADVDNEVYRAWYEMTQMLDVSDPETSTPGEFAAAAISIGMQREHVENITELFEEVRYGDRSPEKREDQAIDIFREIEAEYTETDEDAIEEEATDGESEPSDQEEGQ